METSLITRGFTLIEMVVVLAVVGTIASFTALQDLGAYSRALAGTDVDSVVGALIKARSESMQGICATYGCEVAPAHGVMVSEHQVVVFEGPSYEGRAQSADELFPLQGTDTISGTPEIVFKAYSGDSVEPATLTLSNSTGARWQVTIDSSGAVQSSIESAEPASLVVSK
ncbi:hypothetical protein BH11PAT2_BH11PAT2_06580 [soil metagenome]